MLNDLTQPAAAVQTTKAVSYRWRRNARTKWQYEDWIAISDEEVREMRADGYEVQELACISPVEDAEQPEVAAISVPVMPVRSASAQEER